MNEDDLLERLRTAARDADPPPHHVLDAARAAGARVGLEGELLELRFDSLVDAGAATRAGPGGRVLRFGAPDCTVEVELRGARAVDVVGQLAPAGPDEVELTHAGGRTRAPVDDLGRFTVEGVPAGPASLAWTAPDGGRVRTAWVAL
jgi:hypothetical protein